MRLNFNNGIVDEFSLILTKRNFDRLGQITEYSDLTYKSNMNAADEISFTVYYTDPLFDEISDLRLVWIKDLNEYFQIETSISETVATEKSVTGKSLCEAELSQTILRGIEINSENDIDRSDYVVTTFYNPQNPKGSLLHRILEKVPHYSIGEVSTTLWELQRTFSIDNTSIYDFLTGNCSEQFNCLFTFDSATRTINVEDLYTQCNNNSCSYYLNANNEYYLGTKHFHYRGEFNDKCPYCGSKNITYYGTDTTIFVDKDNLTDEIDYSADVGSVKNCFKLEAGDDLMTASIVNCNPNGSSYIYYFNQETLKDMSQELQNKLSSYNELYNSLYNGYSTLTEQWYESIDELQKLQHSMMPSPEINEFTPTTEAAKLTYANLNKTALSLVSSSTKKETVESALKNIAKLYINTGYVKIKTVNTESWTFKGKDSDNNNYGTWVGNFTLCSWKDDNDTATSSKITIKIYDNYQDFVNQKVSKKLQEGDSESYLFDPLGKIRDITLAQFKEALTKYSLEKLKSFISALSAAITVLTSAGQNDDEATLKEFYNFYMARQSACEDEAKIRQSQIDAEQKISDNILNQMENIQKRLDFEAYVGETLFKEFCSFKREDTYSNSNYISDGLNNAQIIANARDFLDEAKKQIVKSGEYQYSISSNLKNFLIMKEFEPIVDYFELGNWIRFRVGKDIYRLRLISFQINFSDLQTLNTEFSTLTKTAYGYNDVQSILSQASSMASSYSYTTKQAQEGKKANVAYGDLVENGLNSANIVVKSNTEEEVTIDTSGITLKTYDDIENEYSPYQARLTHNIFCFTSDNWKTVESALGFHKYSYFNNSDTLVESSDYGLTSKFVTAGNVYGSQIIGGKIYSKNYSNTAGSKINLEDGTFSLAGGKLTYNGSQLNYTGNMTITGGNLTVNDSSNNQLFKADVTNKTVDLGGWSVLSGGLVWTNNGDDEYKWYDGKGILFSGVGVNAYNDIAKAAQKCSLRIGSNFFLNQEGKLYCQNANVKGNITATSGTFSNVTIDSTCTVKNITGASGTIGGITLDSSGLSSTNFSISSTGVITANSGTIGGWTIGFSSSSKKGYLKSGDSWYEGSDAIIIPGGVTAKINKTEIENVAMKIGSNFGVDTSGNVYCNNALITTKAGSTITKGTTTSPTNLGDWKIVSTSDGGTDFYAMNGDYGTGISTSGTTAIACGFEDASNWTSSPFYVTHKGICHTSAIKITSKDTLTSSTIGRFTVTPIVSGDLSTGCLRGAVAGSGYYIEYYANAYPMTINGKSYDVILAVKNPSSSTIYGALTLTGWVTA